MNDILSITSEIIVLVKEQQLEAAERKVHQALRLQAEASVEARSEAVTSINLQLNRIKMQRETLRQTVQDLPERSRLFAQYQIEEIVDQIFSSEIATLKAKKRSLSRE